MQHCRWRPGCLSCLLQQELQVHPCTCVLARKDVAGSGPKLHDSAAALPCPALPCTCCKCLAAVLAGSCQPDAQSDSHQPSPSFLVPAFSHSEAIGKSGCQAA